MRPTVAESWVEEPISRFVEDTRARFALLLHPSGQVLAQHGFTTPVDVMSACALASAIHASAAQLGREVDGRPFTQLLHAGEDRHIFLAEVATRRGPLVFLTVFGVESSAGLVQLYFRELARALAERAPIPEAVMAGAMSADRFEDDLRRNLDALFGAAASHFDHAARRPTPA